MKVETTQEEALGVKNQAPKFKHHVKRHWPKAFLGLVALVLVAIGFTLLTKPETKPGEAVAEKYSKYWGVAGVRAVNGVSQENMVTQWGNTLGVKTMRLPADWSGLQPCGTGNPPRRDGKTWQQCSDNPINPNSKFKDLALAAKAKGIRVLGVLAYAPAWAQNHTCRINQGAPAWDPAETPLRAPNPATSITVGGGRYLENKPQTCEPRNAEIYGKFAGKAAAYFSQDANGGVHDWELWNEPNTNDFFRDVDSGANPALYAEMVKEAYTQINDEDSSANVVMGATSSAGVYQPSGDTSSTIKPVQFLKEAFQHAYSQGWNLRGYFDKLSHHPYTWSSAGDFDNDDSWFMMYKNVDDQGDSNPGNDVEKTCPTGPTALADFNTWGTGSKANWRPSLRCLLSVYGAGNKKIWNTEYGAPHVPLRKRDGSNMNLSQQTQLDNMKQAKRLWNGYIAEGWAENFYWFHPKDWGTLVASDYESGVVKISAHPKVMGLTTESNQLPTCGGSDGLTPGGSALKAFCEYKKLLNTNVPGDSSGSRGLRGRYFPNKILSGTNYVDRVDSTIDFAWGPDSPVSGVPANDFSVRWIGKVKATSTGGTYRFRTTSDDGVRLYIDGVRVINNWDTHAPEQDVATVTFTANSEHTIWLEYYDEQYGATIKLEWDLPGGRSADFITVPASNLSQ